MKKCKLTYLNKEYEIFEGTLLSEFMIRNGIEQERPCGGTGRCGKCKVKFIYGAPKTGNADRSFLTESEIEAGIRLSCRAVITEDARIDKVYYSDNISDNLQSGSKDPIKKPQADEIKGEVSIALDIGTSTIAVAVMQEKDGGDPEQVSKTTIMNHQRRYGADVISRIQAANSGKAKELRDCVVDDIKSITAGLKIKQMMIAGNTTMLHLLTGDSCEGLGKAPYTPVRLSYPKLKANELFLYKEERESETECLLAPGISAFVGADIVSGMYALSFDRIPKGKRYMLIDLGTNGEMAVADSERISVCSTAAGPVFEGEGISCGMPGVTGAIEHVTLKEDAEFGVIGGEKPLGICGSGVLELVSELRRTKAIDETGLFEDKYFEEGFPLYKGDESTEGIFFTQNDIRAVQLAKAAIRSGIDTLLEAHGCRPEDIDKVYLAGGFSEHLDTSKVRFLKLLPEEFIGRDVCECVGNTSLLGCIKVLGDKDFTDRMNTIVSMAVEIKLAETDEFGDSFIEAMNF